jgi:hypothetical protein
LRQFSCTEKIQTKNLSTKKLREKLLYAKPVRKMLVKLTTEIRSQKENDDINEAMVSLQSMNEI